MASDRKLLVRIFENVPPESSRTFGSPGWVRQACILARRSLDGLRGAASLELQDKHDCIEGCCPTR
jgi:hypothetical protein